MHIKVNSRMDVVTTHSMPVQCLADLPAKEWLIWKILMESGSVSTVSYCLSRKHYTYRSVTSYLALWSFWWCKIPQVLSWWWKTGTHQCRRGRCKSSPFYICISLLTLLTLTLLTIIGQWNQRSNSVKLTWTSTSYGFGQFTLHLPRCDKVTA